MPNRDDVLTETFITEDGFFEVRPPTTGNPYNRVIYYLHGRQHMTSAGKTFGEAADKIDKLSRQLGQDAHKANATVDTLAQHHLDPTRVRPRTGRKWSPKHADTQRRLIERFVLPLIGQQVCDDLSRNDLQKAVDAAPTVGEGERLRRALKAMLTTGWEGGFLTRTVEELMRGVVWQPGQRPMKIRAKQQGASATTVDVGDIPDHEAVAEFAWRAGHLGDDEPLIVSVGKDGKTRRYPPRTVRLDDELAIMASAYSGLRLGEFRWLPGRNVHVRGSSRRLWVEAQYVDVGGEVIEKLPKGEKQRWTVFPEFTPATRRYPQGFPLRERLAQRAALVGPDGLMFTAPRGGIIAPSNLARRLFTPAAAAAGWPRDEHHARADNPDGWVWTWHSLRHVFATYYLWDLQANQEDVAHAAGHANVRTTLEMYSGRTRGTLDRLDELGAAR